MACTRNSDNNNNLIYPPTPTDTIAPVLQLQTPSDNQVFTNGAAIVVSGLVTDDLGLYRGSVKIVNDANGFVVEEKLYEIHFIKSFNYSITYNAVVSVTANYTIIVWFEDHGYNKTTKTIKFKVNP